MSTTKPPRQRNRPPELVVYDRQAERRAALHRDIDAILDAEPHATLERDSIGFSADRSLNHAGGSTPSAIYAADGTIIDTVQLTSVERASQARHLSRAIDWLAERTEALAAITRAANIARANWQPPAAGTTTGGVTIGTRTTVTCAWCNLPIAAGQPSKRIGNDRFHNVSPSWCYHKAGRARGLFGRTKTN